MNLTSQSLNVKQEAFLNHCQQGTFIKICRLKLHEGIDLNCITFTPSAKNALPPIVFVPGFASVIDNFKTLLLSLTEKFIVHYIDTREKATSILPENSGLTVRDIASDISGCVDVLDIKNNSYILLAFSLGATASAEAFNSMLKKKPLLLVLAAPNARFRIPLSGILIARYLSWMYHPLKPLIKLYIKTFHINTRKDYEMYRITVRALDSADPKKMAPMLLDMAKYEIWDSLNHIDVPVLVLGASHDTFHSLDDAKEISMRIPGSRYVDLETNERTHSGEVSSLISSYFVSFLYFILTGSALLTRFL